MKTAILLLVVIATVSLQRAFAIPRLIAPPCEEELDLEGRGEENAGTLTGEHRKRGLRGGCACGGGRGGIRKPIPMLPKPLPKAPPKQVITKRFAKPTNPPKRVQQVKARKTPMPKSNNKNKAMPKSNNKKKAMPKRKQT